MRSEPIDGVDNSIRRRSALMVLVIVATIVYAVSQGWSAILLVVAFVGVIATIMLHEFGHFLVAKRAGMKVTEFFVGFGPRLWSFRRGETEYGVKAIPAGGYVRIIGMHNLEKVDPADETRTYREAPFHSRIAVVLAGPAVNFVIAIVLATTMMWGFGQVDTKDFDSIGTEISDVTEALPAGVAGMRSGDIVRQMTGPAVDGSGEVTTEIKVWRDIPKFVEPRAGMDIEVVAERDGELMTFVLRDIEGVEDANGKTVGKAGVVSPTLPRHDVGFARSLKSGVTDTGEAIKQTLSFIGTFFTPSHLNRYVKVLGGEEDRVVEQERFLSPVGGAQVANEASKQGLEAIMWLLFLINVTLGIVNLAPLFPLDGGHAVVAIYEKAASLIRRRRVQVDAARLMPVTVVTIGIIAFMGLSSLYLDIVKGVDSPF